MYAGWTLRIPVDASLAATTTTQPTPAATAGQLVYEVARGDWLAGVAERFLGDANRYVEIAAMNPDLERRDDRFPNHIERGWRVTLPATPAIGARPSMPRASSWPTTAPNRFRMCRRLATSR
ncbi:hypothetical protein NKG94_17325 [Micromonospora sp. M12]